MLDAFGPFPRFFFSASSFLCVRDRAAFSLRNKLQARRRNLVPQLPLGARLRRATPALPSSRIALQLTLQRRYPRPRRRLPTPQAAHTAERTRACARAHLRAVDRNLLKAHRPRRRERRNLLAQQIVQKRAVTAAKRAQTVIVHRNTAAKPHISRIPLAQQSQTARRTDPLQGRKQPQRQQNRRVRRRTTGTGNPRANLSVKPAQVQTLHETPNNPRPVVRRKQTLKVNHPPFQLTPIRAQNTNTTRHRNPLYSTRPKLNRTQQSKQINQILFLHSLEGGGPSMAPDAAATGGEQGEPPAAAAKTKAGPRLGGRGDGRGHAIQSQRKQMCESGSQQAGAC